MTKKYWNNWQNRIKETKQIWLRDTWAHDERTQKVPLLKIFDRDEVLDKITHIHFEEDVVYLTIERVPRRLDSSAKRYENVVLNRADVISVDFE